MSKVKNLIGHSVLLRSNLFAQVRLSAYIKYGKYFKFDSTTLGNLEHPLLNNSGTALVMILVEPPPAWVRSVCQMSKVTYKIH